MRKFIIWGLMLSLLGVYPLYGQISGGLPSTVGDAGGGHVIKDEGTARPQRGNMNFVGGGVDVTDTAGSDETTVTITGVGTGLPDPTGTGVVVKDSATPTTVSRTITGTANQITVTNGSGVSGNPTLSIPTNPTLPGTTTGTFSGNVTGNVTGNADTSTALAADGANCSAGQFPLGVSAAGVAQNCTALPTTITGVSNQIDVSAPTGAITLSIPTNPILPGTTTGTFIGDISGNATSATALAANGANCSAGSAPLGVGADGAAEGCFDVGTQTELDTHINGTSVHSATDANTASRIVLRDASGNFAAGTITANLTGNASGTAGSLAANGANCSAGSFPLGVDAFGAVESCTDGATQTELDTHVNGTAVHSATAANTADRIVLRDASGNFAAGTITAALTGNASTSTALAANGTNCGAGEAAAGVDASGNAEGCTAVGGGGGTPIVLDLADNGVNESTDLAEVATTGDTNNIFTEPTANKLLITLSNDWPKADLADALAANGANCSAGSAPIGVDAAGAVESCFDVATQTELDTHTNATNAHSATATNTADRIVLRDGSGNFAAGTITAALTGNASTATALAANPANCTVAGTFGNGITAAGVPENCVTLSAINSQNATYQVLAADFDGYKTITVPSGTFTITLVATGSQPADGKYIHVVNYGSGVVTIARSGQNINGGTTSLTLPAGSATDPSSAVVLSNGTDYFADVRTSNAAKNAATATLTNKTIDLTSNTLVGSVAEFNAALEAADFATLAGTETLTGKTLNLNANTLSGTRAEFNAALSDDNFATLTGTETLTGKTLSLAVNTVVGTTAEFNAALSDNDFATLAGTETLTGKTVNLANNTVTGTLAEFNTAVSDGNFVTDARTVTIAGTANEITSSAGAQDLTANRTWTLSLPAAIDLGGKALEIPNSTTLPATCTVGQIYMDTDATSGQRIYACQATDTWALQGDGGSGGLTDGDKGDITVSGAGATFTIDNDVVTYAKMQNVSATDRLLGRDTAGAGDVEELTASGGLEFTGTGIQRSALTGDVTATAGSNTTTIANDAVTNAKAANMAVNTIKGRQTAGTGDPEDLTVTQAKTVLGLENVSNTSDATKNSATATLTNKRVTPRLNDVADASPIATDSDAYDFILVSALSQNTTFSIPTGTPTHGQLLRYSICTTVSRTLTFTTGTNGFSADYGIPLPVASPASGCMSVGFQWNGDIAKWSIIGSTQGQGGGLGQKNLPITGIKFPTTGVTAAVLDRSETNDRLLFDTGVSWCADWQFVAPSDYGSSPTMRFEYSMSSATTGSFHLNVQVMAVTPGDAADINAESFATANDCNDTTVPATAGHLDVITCALANNDSMAANDFLKIRICRDVANDNAAGNAELVGAAFEYTKQ